MKAIIKSIIEIEFFFAQSTEINTYFWQNPQFHVATGFNHVDCSLARKRQQTNE